MNGKEIRGARMEGKKNPGVAWLRGKGRERENGLDGNLERGVIDYSITIYIDKSQWISCIMPCYI